VVVWEKQRGECARERGMEQNPGEEPLILFPHPAGTPHYPSHTALHSPQPFRVFVDACVCEKADVVETSRALFPLVAAQPEAKYSTVLTGYCEVQKLSAL